MWLKKVKLNMADGGKGERDNRDKTRVQLQKIKGTKRKKKTKTINI